MIPSQRSSRVGIPRDAGFDHKAQLLDPFPQNRTLDNGSKLPLAGFMLVRNGADRKRVKTMKRYRAQRLASLVRDVVSELLVTGSIKDPRIAYGDALVTVTDVESTPDLRLVKIFVSAVGEPEETAKIIEGLTSAKGFIRSQIAPHLKMRWVPDLVFIPDDSIARGVELLNTIERVNREATQDDSA